MPDRMWTDADRAMVAKAVHDYACLGDGCSWAEEDRACDLTEFEGWGDAVLDALTAAGWQSASESQKLHEALRHMTSQRDMLQRAVDDWDGAVARRHLGQDLRRVEAAYEAMTVCGCSRGRKREAARQAVDALTATSDRDSEARDA